MKLLDLPDVAKTFFCSRYWTGLFVASSVVYTDTCVGLPELDAAKSTCELVLNSIGPVLDFTIIPSCIFKA